MRRITGTLDQTEHVILEYDNGVVEVPATLRDQLADPDGTMPMGQALEARLRQVFGESLRITDYAPGEIPPDATRP